MRLLLLSIGFHLVRAWVARGGGGGAAGDMPNLPRSSPTSSSSSGPTRRTECRLSASTVTPVDQQQSQDEQVVVDVVEQSSLVRQLPPLAPGVRRVVLMRHGETDWNRRGMIQGGGYDLELNAAGQQQALEAQAQLQGLPLGVIASSQLERSSQTADVVAQAFPQAVRVIQPKFGEMRFGSFEGVQVRRVEQDYPEASQQRAEQLQLVADYHEWNQQIATDDQVAWPGGGESRANVVQRGTAGLDQILRSFPDCDHVCIVAHGRFNKLLLASLLGLTNTESIVQGNTCINILDVDREGQWKALVLNHMEHIASSQARHAPS